MTMRFGLFISPYSNPSCDPTAALHRNLALVRHADARGFHEAWVGEHHSNGYQIIGSPEVFIATAAQQTERIKLGTGVVSLPYHHPFQVAERMVLLDHLTRGRVMFGVGPGALPLDASMMGIDPMRQRQMMEQSLECILALFRGESVTCKTDWFELSSARLQLLPYTRPCFEVAVSAVLSPSGPRLAGRFGTSMLAMAATVVPGFDGLSAHWNAYTEQCESHGHVPDRSRWRLVGPMHIAPTLEQAEEEVRHGLLEGVRFYQQNKVPLCEPYEDHDKLVRAVVDSGAAVIGTPQDAIERIRELEQRSKGFGTYLLSMTDWADEEATKRSLDLFANEVMPAFTGSREAPQRSWQRTLDMRDDLSARAGAATVQAVQVHLEGKSEGSELLDIINGGSAFSES